MKRSISLAAVVVLVVAAGVLAFRSRSPSSGPVSDAPPAQADSPRASELQGLPHAEPAHAQPPADRPPEPALPEVGEPPAAPPLDGPPIEGVVLDADTGYAVVGAVVRLRRGGSTKNWSELHVGGALGETISDASGAFRFDASPREGLLTVAVSCAGYASVAQTLEPVTGAVPRRVQLRLQRAGSLVGEVQRPDGTWAGGATVFVLPADAPEMLLADPTGRGFGGGRTWEAFRGVVRADGSYVVEGLELGASYVAAALEPGGAQSVWSRDIVSTEAAPQVRRDLVLRAPATIRVRALAPDGTVLKTARMLLFKSSWMGDLESAAAGVHERRGIVPGAYVLRVDAPNLLRKETPLTLEAGATVSLDVPLEGGVPLAGVLVDDVGRPVANQTIFVSKPWWRADELPDSDGRVTTDDQGRFRFEGLHRQPHKLGLVLGKHYVPELQLIEAPDENVRFQVLRMAALHAHLVLPPGVEAPETVGLRIGHSVREGWPEDQEGWEEGGSSLDWNGGDVRVPSLPPLPCRVRLLVEGCAPSTTHIEFRPGEVLDLGDVRLDRGVELTVRVQDAAGEPIAGAAVGVRGAPIAAATTDAEGRCVLSTLARGKHEIEVEADDFLSKRVWVEVPEETDLRLRLDRGGVVICRVVTESGKPAADITLRWRPAGDAGAESQWDYDTTNHHGLLELRLAPGRWVVEAFDDAWTSDVRAEVAVAEGVAMEQSFVAPAR